MQEATRIAESTNNIFSIKFKVNYKWFDSTYSFGRLRYELKDALVFMFTFLVKRLLIIIKESNDKTHTCDAKE